MNEERVIARIPRNASDELVIRTGVYWNLNILDIRWYKKGNHTQKGCRVNMDEAKHLLRAIDKAVNNNDKQEND